MDFWFSEQQARMRFLPDTKRYLFDKIDWNQQCIGLLGARGTGKTTLLLQYIKSKFSNSDKALYISLDHPGFQTISLFESASDFFRYGGEVLILDEVHKYADWSSHVKSIYDNFPTSRLIFSGSSLLKIKEQNADLSRRAVVYYLNGLSFREYLFFSNQLSFSPVSLAELFKTHIEKAKTVTEQIRPLKCFQEYLEYGYFPFFLEGRDIYPVKLAETVNQILERDLMDVCNINVRQIAKLKKLLYMLSVSVPTKLNIQKLSSMTEISRPKIYEYLEYFKQARLINNIRETGKGHKVLSKPDKLYMENPNLSFALARTPDVGTIRESFFVNQIWNALTLNPAFLDDAIEQSENGDFIIRGKHIVEVGGKQKGFKQIANIKNAFVAADGVEYGTGRKIPLWLFGFLY